MKQINQSFAAILCILLSGFVPMSSLTAQEAPSLTPRAKGKTSLKKIFKILKGEPTIRQVHAWALRHHKLEPERVHALARNARLKGLIPQLQVSLSNQFTSNIRNTLDGLYPNLPSPASNPNPESFKEREEGRTNEIGWSLNATWTLDRLAFNGEALDAKSLTSLEENLVREVSTVYYSRRRIIASLLMSPPEGDEELFYEVMRLEELTSTLDAFTGLKFGKKSWDWEKEVLGKLGIPKTKAKPKSK